jgi:hypothetical protein
MRQEAKLIDGIVYTFFFEKKNRYELLLLFIPATFLNHESQAGPTSWKRSRRKP